MKQITESPLKLCKCGIYFRDSESVGSSFGECQNCWEKYCDEEWWRILGRANEPSQPTGTAEESAKT